MTNEIMNKPIRNHHPLGSRAMCEETLVACFKVTASVFIFCYWVKPQQSTLLFLALNAKQISHACGQTNCMTFIFINL